MKIASKLLCAVAVLSFSCSSLKEKIKIQNYEFYGDKGVLGATMVESLKPEKPGVRIPKAEWDQRRLGMVCTSAANIADIQANIDRLCALNKFACAYVAEEVVELKKSLTLIEESVK